MKTEMAGGVVYLDTSALVKLVAAERESEPLRAFLASHPWRASSVVAAVELRRAVRRALAGPRAEERSERVLAGVVLLQLDREITLSAGRLSPPELRSLDAIHVSSALALLPEPVEFVTYDARQAAAAAAAGLRVVTPD